VNGNPSRSFWQSIYKPRQAYGPDVITGWLGDLFPYLVHPESDAPTVRNSFVTTESDGLNLARGLSPKHVPNGLSQAPFVVTFQESDAQWSFDLVAGFIGVVEDETTGEVQPEIGWAITENVKGSKEKGQGSLLH
jgi:hypothetical protein